MPIWQWWPQAWAASVPLDFQGVQLTHDPDGRPLGRAVEVAFESGYADAVLVSDAKAVEHLAD